MTEHKLLNDLAKDLWWESNEMFQSYHSYDEVNTLNWLKTGSCEVKW